MAFDSLNPITRAYVRPYSREATALAHSRGPMVPPAREAELNTPSTPYLLGQPATTAIIRAGLIGGLAGRIVIWIYEGFVCVGAQHLMPLASIPPNATGFGFRFQKAIGGWAYALGTGIHFTFAIASGVQRAILNSNHWCMAPWHSYGRLPRRFESYPLDHF